MTTIYLSSTYEDLKDYRSAVFEALRKAGHRVLAMEDYVATDRRPVEKCLVDVAEADIYVGLFAFRYGYVPPAEHGNPDGLSITELEFRHAEKLGKPCLAFAVSEDAPWPPKFIDGLKGERINRLRHYLLTEKTASFFSSPHELASLVLAAVTKHLLEKTDEEKDILRGGYHDGRVEAVRTELNQLHRQAHDPPTFLTRKIFLILRGLFVGRNTFIEPADDCRDESWAERFIATIETRRLIEAYRPVIIDHARPEELMRSYDPLNLHSYLQELTGLFDPRPRVNKITERLKNGDFGAVELELKRAEIHPKERIDPKVIAACNRRQREIKQIWEQWPVR